MISRLLRFSFVFIWLLVWGTYATVAKPEVLHIVGSVADIAGDPVSGAKLDALCIPACSSTEGAVTDAHGFFQLSITSNAQSLRVRAVGYLPAFIRLNNVTVGHNPRLTIVLRPVQSGSIIIARIHASQSRSLTMTTAPFKVLDATQAAQGGVQSVAAMLENVASVTPVLPLGASGNAPTSFAVRGPDPTETAIDIDGHLVNSGSTGDFDLSLLDPATLQQVEVIYGIAPSSLVGPNTIGGVVNIVTLQPTAKQRTFVRMFGGSFGSYGQTIASTGTTSQHLGYALAFHHSGMSGEVGDGLKGASTIVKLRQAIGQNGAFVQVSQRTQTSWRDLSAVSLPGTTAQNRMFGYGLDAAIPMMLFRQPVFVTASHFSSLHAQALDGPGTDSSPYLYNFQDALSDDWIRLDRRFRTMTVTLKIESRIEHLATDFLSGTLNTQSAKRIPTFARTMGLSGPNVVALAQSQRSAVLRFSFDPTEHIHYTLATYASNFSSFGSSVDPRFGIAWKPTSASLLRFSLGTSFQSPQLTELYVPPVLPPPVNGLISIGNPNLKADHATEYDIGFEHLFAGLEHPTRMTIDLYRSNVRTPAGTFIPINYDPNCTSGCLTTYPVNAGNAVYTGAEVSLNRALSRDTHLSVSWDVDSSYLTHIPAAIAGGSLVVGQQTLGQPLHKASLAIDGAFAHTWFYAAAIHYQGTYNALNRPPYATLDASLARTFDGMTIGIYGTNLTNVYDTLFTQPGGGIPYGGAGGTTIPTDAYPLQGTRLEFIVSRNI